MNDYFLKGVQAGRDEFNRILDNIYHKNATAQDKLTGEQFIDAVTQALQCGDFLQYVYVDKKTQTVTYEPFRRYNELRNEFNRRIDTIKELCERLKLGAGGVL